ncbi:CMRF35-like molecule 5 [Danio aesculapii]|uniref:CMRF35-like molecule 5 n=1 Tax=Danio aesculapii TaxID=1142201 RepID=UPI0024C081FA|nr:CMRF35-like molecule 5 [Danio aesculapii]
MWSFLPLLWSWISIAGVVSVPDKLSGHRGQRFDIKCRYNSGYETNVKYFCRGTCHYGNKDIIVHSGSPAKDERFSLTDDTTNKVFTITITDLRTEDAGTYWCAVERVFLTDVYSEIVLLVEQDAQTTLPQRSTSDSDSAVVIVSSGVSVLLLIGAVTFTVIIRKKKQNCGPVSSTTEGLDLTLRNGEENEYEKENPTVLPNAHTAQSVNHSAENSFPRAENTHIFYINSPYHMYTELNTRQTDLYHSLTADSAQQESVYHNI